MRSVEVIAHRGASAYAAEHTFDAFDLALARGAHRLELDVRATADGQLVVVHDATLLRTTGDPRAVSSLTLSDLARLDRATRPPALEAVLARYGDATRWLIELKQPEPSWELRAVEAIDRHGLRDRAIVQSFDGRALRRVHAAAPGIALAPLWRRAPGPRRWELTVPWAAAVSVRSTEVDAELVAAARAHGLPVNAWIVNDPAEFERLTRLGVDGVITDRPDVGAPAVASLSLTA